MDANWLAMFVLAAIVCCVGLLVMVSYQLKRFGEGLRKRATAECELAQEIKLVIEDLRSRDPQLQDPLDVALLEIDRLIAELEQNVDLGRAVGTRNLRAAGRASYQVRRIRRGTSDQ